MTSSTQLGERRRQAIALSYIAALYSAANDGGKAEQYYRQAAGVYGGDPALSLTLRNNRGNVLLALERYNEAGAEYLEAIKIARQLKDPLIEARVLGNLARAQVDENQLDAAERTLTRGFALAPGSDAKGFRQQLLATSAYVALQRGDLKRAKRLITQGIRRRGPDRDCGCFPARRISMPI
ncbi:MAG: tetratricopeptide repeat protein [Sphingomonas sp.]